MTNPCMYIAGINLGAQDRITPLGTLTLSAAAVTDIVINLGQLTGADVNSVQSSYAFHFLTTAAQPFGIVGNDPAASVRFGHYSRISLGGMLSNAVNARCTAQSWPTSNWLAQFFEVSGGFSVPFPFYRFTYPSNFRFQFSTLAGARLFGHNSTALSSSGTLHNFAGNPDFIWWPSTVEGLQAISVDEELDGLDYEAEGIASLVHADDGRGFMSSRTVSPLYRDWWQKFCPPERMFREQGAQQSPPLWTAQQLFEQCRKSYPFLVAHGRFGNGSSREYEAFQLRSAGAQWRPRRASIANAVYYHVPFRCSSIGHVETAS